MADKPKDLTIKGRVSYPTFTYAEAVARNAKSKEIGKAGGARAFSLPVRRKMPPQPHSALSICLKASRRLEYAPRQARTLHFLCTGEKYIRIMVSIESRGVSATCRQARFAPRPWNPARRDGS